jgi:hypothetical protein
VMVIAMINSNSEKPSSDCFPIRLLLMKIASPLKCTIGTNIWSCPLRNDCD